jgi:molybdopterin-guanine dinucleotide biosynthesis protein A
LTALAARSGLAGLVLAGGRSVRFGGEKAAALLGGRTLLGIALDRLNASCAVTAVSAAEGSQAAALAAGWEAPVLHDPPGAPRGPLAGICAGLGWALARGAPLLAVLPCDLPGTPPELFDRLVAAIGDADGAAVARTPDGLQSLCLVARSELHGPLAAMLDRGEHPAVQAWLEAVGAREVAFADASGFANINTPEDLLRIAAT